MNREIYVFDVLPIVRRRFWIIIIPPILALIAASITVFFVIKPLYEASTSFLVGNNEVIGSVSATPSSYQDVLASQQLVKTYAEIAKSSSVIEEVLQKMGLGLNLEQLREKITVTLVTGAPIVRLAATDTDPGIAQQIANTTADVFLKRVTEFTGLNNVTTVDQAVLPLLPFKPQKALTLVTAMMIGLMLGLGWALLMEYVDDKIRTTEDAENCLGIPVFAAVPKFKTTPTG